MSISLDGSVPPGQRNTSESYDFPVRFRVHDMHDLGMQQIPLQLVTGLFVGIASSSNTTA
jgi:hypothetical protein